MKQNILKKEKLRGKYYFNKLLKNKRIFKGEKYLFFYKYEDFNYIKFGVSVSKKIGKAHVRNREKRWIREIIRKNKNKAERGGLLLIIVKKKDGSYKNAEEEIVKFIETIFSYN